MRRKFTPLEWLAVILIPIFFAAITLFLFDYFKPVIALEITYPGIITTLLALITALLAIFGIGLAILAVLGFYNIKSEVVKAAEKQATKVAEKQVTEILRYRIGTDEPENDENS